MPEAPIQVPPGKAMWEAIKDLVQAVLVRTSTASERIYVEQVPSIVAVPWSLPVGGDPGQAWFWTPEWLAGEAEVSAELAAGLAQTFMSVEDFLADLDS